MTRKCLLGIALVIVLAGCSEKKDSTGTFERPLPVKTSEAVQKDVPVYVDAIGNISAYQTVEIRPQVSGKLSEVRIQGGDDVKAGDILFQIDPLPFQLTLAREKANMKKDKAELDFAKQKVERYSQIAQSDYVSKLSIEEYKKDVSFLEAQIAVNEANINTAKLNLSYCVIRSPIDGRVNLDILDSGNLVSPTDQIPLATVLKMSPIEVDFSISQHDFENLQSLLKAGERKFIGILPSTKKEFEGVITGVNSQINLKTGTIQIKGQIPNQDKILWPGEFVTVRVFIKLLKGVMIVPDSAIQVGQNGTFLYILNEDQTVKNIPMKILEHLEGFVAIESDVKAGQKVITDGQLNLRPGAKVMVMNDIAKESPVK